MVTASFKQEMEGNKCQLMPHVQGGVRCEKQIYNKGCQRSPKETPFLSIDLKYVSDYAPLTLCCVTVVHLY